MRLRGVPTLSEVREVIGRLQTVKRLPSSQYGNPRWAITLDTDGLWGIEYRTQANASVGYEVPNFKQGRQVTLTLSKRGGVIGMRYVEGER